ncbi:MAG: hypothetical protein LBM61_04955, partial [Prevotellaceae bacterium]|nr:hypothetical protein [Prevotellaceae bacterium]
MRKYVFICWLAIAFANVCASETDSILQVLFVEMNYKELYTNQREERIRQLESMLNVHSITAEQRYHIYDDLAHAYNTFQMDSTLHYLDLNKEIAEFLGDMELLYHTKIQLASAYWLKGRTLEAEKELDSINRELLTTMPKQLLMDYYDA